jgi:hypothetical protein
MKHPLKATLVGLLFVLSAYAASADLPLSRVVLFSSGVGYFERAGQVEGNAKVELSFKTEQINDLLKSLVLQDLDGGRIAPVVYSPQEPLTRTLQSFSLDLSQDRPLATMLSMLRGAKVEIVADGTVRGSVLGVETQQKSSDKGVVSFSVVNVVTDTGITQIPLWHIKSIKLLDEKLSGDLAKALGVLNASHDSGKRPLTLSFEGAGKRHVRVGYLLETPVWKTSYRLLVDEKGLFLQAWAIVENTTDDDWQGVKLSLVSGRPISFVQDLYQPLYVSRPVVAPSVVGSPLPQTYEGAMEAAAKGEAGPQGPRGAPGMGGFGGRRGGMPGMPGAAATPYNQQIVESNSNAAMLAPMPGESEGVDAMAAGEKVGELFQYAIDQPVTVARHQSAMIPIINKGIEGAKVSIYNQAGNLKYPLNGLRLKNTSGLQLMGGPITVFDGGVYAGDALTTDIAPDDDRLVTYAVDLGVEVAPKVEETATDYTSLKISRGVLLLTRKQHRENSYTAKNVTDEKRTLLIEQQIQDGWDLISPAKPNEKTAHNYRFKLEIAPKTTEKLTVVEEHPISETVALIDRDATSFGLYIRAPKISDAVKTALQKIVEMKTTIADVAAQWTDRDARLKEITSEQERIRNNMAQLDRNSDLYKRYVEKFTAQETEYEKLQAEMKKLHDQQKGLQDELTAYISGLNVE